MYDMGKMQQLRSHIPVQLTQPMGSSFTGGTDNFQLQGWLPALSLRVWQWTYPKKLDLCGPVQVLSALISQHPAQVNLDETVGISLYCHTGPCLTSSQLSSGVERVSSLSTSHLLFDSGL